MKVYKSSLQNYILTETFNITVYLFGKTNGRILRIFVID